MQGFPAQVVPPARSRGVNPSMFGCPAGLTRAQRQLVVVSAGGDPLSRAVRRAQGDARLTWLRARLEEGRREGGLPELEPQTYSNEEQMLEQAARWQQQAQQRAAEQRAAAAQSAAAVEAEHCHDDWAPGASSSSGSSSSSNSAAFGSSSSSSSGSALDGQVAPPSAELLVAAQQQLQRREGFSSEEAAEWVGHLLRHHPGCLQDWDRACVAVGWLRRKFGGVAAEVVVREAPQLLASHPAQLDNYWRFLEGRPGFVGSDDSALGNLHALRSRAGQQAQQAQQEQLQQAQQAQQEQLQQARHVA